MSLFDPANCFCLLETTQWDDEYSIPSHIYIIERGRSGRLLGFIPSGQTEGIMYAKPKIFDKRRRQFKKLKVSNVIQTV